LSRTRASFLRTSCRKATAVPTPTYWLVDTRRAQPSTNFRPTPRRRRGSTFTVATLSNGQITYDGQMFMTYAAEFLCNRHSHLYDNF
jgi:hypothetical protein